MEKKQWRQWHRDQIERCMKEERDMEYMVKLLDRTEEEIQEYIQKTFSNVVEFRSMHKNNPDTLPKLNLVSPSSRLEIKPDKISINPKMATHLIDCIEKARFFRGKMEEAMQKNAPDLPPAEAFKCDFLFHYYKTHWEHWENTYENMLLSLVQTAIDEEQLK